MSHLENRERSAYATSGNNHSFDVRDLYRELPSMRSHGYGAANENTGLSPITISIEHSGNQERVRIHTGRDIAEDPVKRMIVQQSIQKALHDATLQAYMFGGNVSLGHLFANDLAKELHNRLGIAIRGGEQGATARGGERPNQGGDNTAFDEQSYAEHFRQLHPGYISGNQQSALNAYEHRGWAMVGNTHVQQDPAHPERWVMGWMAPGESMADFFSGRSGHLLPGFYREGQYILHNQLHME